MSAQIASAQLPAPTWWCNEGGRVVCELESDRSAHDSRSYRRAGVFACASEQGRRHSSGLAAQLHQLTSMMGAVHHDRSQT